MKEQVKDWLRSVFGGKSWIVATDVLAGSAAKAKLLQDYGATSALCIGAAPGTGPMPDPEFAPNPICFDVRAPSMMESIRLALDILANMPDDTVARVDEFDPGKTMQVIGTIFDDGRPVAGRSKYGARPESWQALEDKTIIDKLWDAAGVTRAPSMNVDVFDVERLATVSDELDYGDGVVWAADSREGFHGGAALTRWVRTSDDQRDVRTYFAGYADTIRIMPFLEGIPCSIHGIVFPDYVAVLRPCEMIVFRKPSGEFQYGKASTFWDPPQARRDEMRTFARTVGEHLRAKFGYRGAFTIDGVMTADGFKPTELNPRFGAALGVMTTTLDFPMLLVNLALVEGEDVPFSAREFEARVLKAADENRSGSTMAVFNTPFENEDEVDMVWTGDGFRKAHDGEVIDATSRVGPHSAGGIVFVKFPPDRVPIGEPLAPRAAKALEFVSGYWDLGISELEPPKVV